MLAQGKILSSASVTVHGGRHAVIIPIQSAMAPKCRLLAYFIKQTSTGEEIVSDAVELNVEAMCKTKDVKQKILHQSRKKIRISFRFCINFVKSYSDFIWSKFECRCFLFC